MAKAETPAQAAERLARERVTVRCRYCGGPPKHFPPDGCNQNDATCDSCAEFPPGTSVVDHIARLVEEPPSHDELKVYVGGIRFRQAPVAPDTKPISWKDNFQLPKE